MPTVKITQALVKQLETSGKPKTKGKYYDQSLSGFLVVHYTSGRIAFCVRTRIKGTSGRTWYVECRAWLVSHGPTDGFPRPAG